MNIEFLTAQNPDVLGCFQVQSERTLYFLEQFRKNGGHLDTLWISEYNTHSYMSSPEPPCYDVWHLLPYAISKNDADVALWLLDQGVSVNFNNYKTLLHSLTGTTVSPLGVCLNTMGEAMAHHQDDHVQAQYLILNRLFSLGASLFDRDAGCRSYPLDVFKTALSPSGFEKSPEIVGHALWDVLQMAQPHTQVNWAEQMTSSEEPLPCESISTQEPLMQVLRACAEKSILAKNQVVFAHKTKPHRL